MLPSWSYDGADAMVDAEAVHEAVYKDVELRVVEGPDGGQGVCEVVEGEGGCEEESWDGGCHVVGWQGGRDPGEACDCAGLKLRGHVEERCRV